MLTPEQIAEHTLKRGSKYPYDAPDKWWDGDGENPPTPLDWAHHAARGVLADLNDRGGIKHGFANIDEDIRAEIVRSLATIIRIAYRPEPSHADAATIARGPCSAYIDRRMICRNGFPIKNTCWTGSRWGSETSRPHCMNEDYCPPHLIDSDTGFPILAVRAELERNSHDA